MAPTKASKNCSELLRIHKLYFGISEFFGIPQYQILDIDKVSVGRFWFLAPNMQVTSNERLAIIYFQQMEKSANRLHANEVQTIYLVKL
jgi:hypothetical protein